MSMGFPLQLVSWNALLIRLSVLITIAWLMVLANFVSVLLCIPHGWGQHAWNVTIQDATKLDRVRFPFFRLLDITYLSIDLLPIMMTYVWCPVLTRLAILSVLYRINPSRWFRISAYAIAFAVVVYSVTITVLLSGPCNPIDAGSQQVFDRSWPRSSVAEHIFGRSCHHLAYSHVVETSNALQEEDVDKRDTDSWIWVRSISFCWPNVSRIAIAEYCWQPLPAPHT